MNNYDVDLKKKKLSILNLPNEIIFLFAKHLDWKSVINFKSAGKKFYSIIELTNSQILDTLVHFQAVELWNCEKLDKQLRFFVSKLNWMDPHITVGLNLIPIVSKFGSIAGLTRIVTTHEHIQIPKAEWDPDDTNENALHLIIKLGYFDLLKILDFCEIINYYYQTIHLDIAAKFKKFDVFKYLYSRFNMSTSQIISPLLFDYDPIFLNYRLNFSVEDLDTTELLWACSEGYFEIVKVLLRDGTIDPSRNDNKAINRANNSNQFAIVKLLLSDIRCGSNFQSFNEMNPGFIDIAILEKKKKMLAENNENLNDLTTLTKPQLNKILKKKTELICKRCHSLKNDNSNRLFFKQSIPLKNIKIFEELQVTNKPLLYVYIVDALDFPSSFIKNISQTFNFNNNNSRLLIVFNKMDLVQFESKRNLRETKTTGFDKRYFINLLKMEEKFSNNFDYLKDVTFVSAKTGEGLFELIEKINEKIIFKDENENFLGCDVYFVGKTNVGKSNLLNALKKIGTGKEENTITTSNLPGTTVNVLKTPAIKFGNLFKSSKKGNKNFQANFYDTPGIKNEVSLTKFLVSKELKYLEPRQTLRPIGIRNFKETVFLGGLIRLDLLEAEYENQKFQSEFELLKNKKYYERVNHLNLIFFGSNLLKLNVCKTFKAEENYKNLVTENLVPPLNFGKSKEDRLKLLPDMNLVKEFEIKQTTTEEKEKEKLLSTDIHIANVGWICLYGNFSSAKFRLFSLGGIGCGLRKSYYLPKWDMKNQRYLS
ncbi:hypothetical protein HK099_002369 [Clydaea vesicula]|uniref:F-box domain-containing protein n=1 Tax=Clydaea vesicula TaxID=447962 RepID=A0AAD5U2I3_9FUNG|nr:hypothetical protein HK099_002369 [Clydaea vesicula]